MKQSESVAKLFPDLILALGEIGGVTKSANNTFFKSKYATLEDVIEASKSILRSHELAVMQGGGDYGNGALTITTRIIHASGEWIESTMDIPLAKADPQGAGSAVTYGRRYALMAMLNMPAVDDDGNHATHGQGHAAALIAKDRKSAAQAKRDLDHEKLIAAIKANKTEAALDNWYLEFDRHTAEVPLSWLDPLRDEVEKHRNWILDGGI